MSSKLAVCGVCEYRNINKPSDVWCSECDEGLCGECKEHHSSSKGTRNHHIVPVSEYQYLPSNILEITQTCPKHDDKYVIFCKKHDCPCCRRCVTETHNDCKEIDVIDDVITNVKSSNAFLEIEHSLAELSENLQRIRKDRQENIKSLLENRANIEKEVNQTRKLIDNHLDKLQKSLIKELYAAEKKESTKIKNIISSVEETERTISESQTTFDKIKQHASDLQTFLALKHIQRDVTNNEQFLESLIEEKMNHVSISWKNENAVEIIPTTIKKIGTIILDTRARDATLTNRKNKQAQIMVPTTHVPTIDDVRLTLRQTVKTIGKDIRDCILLPDGKMIFTCYSYNQIHVIKTDGTLDFKLEPAFNTSHICYIEESQTLVVTSGYYKHRITIIDMKNRKTKKSIDVGSKVYGIVHKDGKLFYNGSKGGLCGLKLEEDDSITQLVNVPLSPLSNIAIWSNNLYFINEDDSLTCCDLKGGIKWKLELQAFLRMPRGFTVDNYGCVYVSGFQSNNIVVISPDGNKHRVLLSEKDGLNYPQSVCFNRKNNKLLVANKYNDALLYDVSS